MTGIVGLIALLTVLALSLFVTRLATTALTLTGLSREAARFQARSAFTGTGFTTAEAETVVNHPVRRRIIMLLMVVRSAGLVTIIISLILSFVDTEGRLSRLGWLLAGVVVLWILANSRGADWLLTRVINRALKHWTDLDTRDYAALLKLHGDYLVTELQVQEGDWIVGKCLKDCSLPEEGITVLGIYRTDGAYVGAPKPETEFHAGDTLLLYGLGDSLKELDERRADASGERAHEEAVKRQRQRDEEQESQERESERKRRETVS